MSTPLPPNEIYLRMLTLVLSPRGVTDPQTTRDGIPLGRYTLPNHYTQLAKTTFQIWISQLLPYVVFHFPSWYKLIITLNLLGFQTENMSKKSDDYTIGLTIVDRIAESAGVGTRGEDVSEVQPKEHDDTRCCCTLFL